MPGACAVYDAIDGELLSRIVLSVATCCSVIRVCSSVPCWRVPVFAPLKASHRPCARFLPPRASLALMTLCCNLWSGHREAQAHPLWLSLAPARWLYRSAALAAPRLACERDDAAAALTRSMSLAVGLAVLREEHHALLVGEHVAEPAWRLVSVATRATAKKLVLVKTKGL